MAENKLTIIPRANVKANPLINCVVTKNKIAQIIKELKEELKTVADLAIVDIISGQDDTIVDLIIAESIDLMSSYLSNYYNHQLIFAATAGNRSLVVLKHLKAIVLLLRSVLNHLECFLFLPSALPAFFNFFKIVPLVQKKVPPG